MKNKSGYSIGMNKLLEINAKDMPAIIPKPENYKIINYMGQAKVEVISFYRPIAKLDIMIFETTNTGNAI